MVKQGMSLLPSYPAFFRGRERRFISQNVGNFSRNIISTPTRPSPEPLLLQGDEFYVSRDGVSRTYYELKTYISSQCQSLPALSLEEFYDLKGARKTFIARSSSTDSNLPPKDDVLGANVQGVAKLGRPLYAFELQEIDRGVFGSAGTGSTTWESSIAMSLFFSSNPWLLRGDVLELGSGVGLTGLLSQLYSTSLTELKSLTLTDGNEEVLEQCCRNMEQVQYQAQCIPIRVTKLDWYDYVDPKDSIASQQYDTVLASDCAYLYPDVVALSCTLVALCRNDERAKIHVFGPYNRGALHDLVIQLRDHSDMDVVLDWIELSRYRLKPHREWDHFTFPDSANVHRFCQSQDECPFASRNTAQFLHITASHKRATQRQPRLSDID